jgi:hypothetical protein
VLGCGHGPGELGGRVELGQVGGPGLDLGAGPAGPAQHGLVVVPQETPHQAAERQSLRERAEAVEVVPGNHLAEAELGGGVVDRHGEVGAREAGAPDVDGQLGADGGEEQFSARPGPGWPLTDTQRRRLALTIAAALATGWDPAVLAGFVGANTAGVRSPAAVLAARLSSAELPAPSGGAPARPRPPWCGAADCDERTRRLQLAEGADGGRCPRCHPLAADVPGGVTTAHAALGYPAFPVGPAPGVAGRTAGQPARQSDSLQAPVSLSARGRWPSHSA